MGRRPKLWQLVALAVVAALPVIVVALSPWSASTGALLIAVLPVTGVWRGGARALGEVVGAGVVVTVVSLLLADTGALLPWLGTALVVMLSLVASPLVRLGRESAGALLVVLAAYLMTVPDSAAEPFLGSGPFPAAASLGALVGLTSGWAAVVIWFATRRVRLPEADVPTPTLPYTVLLAVLAGLFTFVSLAWFRETNAWWSVLTVAVVLQPTGARMRAKLLARVAGTSLGGIIALAAALWLPPDALGIVGGAAAVTTVVLKVTARPYWTYATALTVTVVLTSFSPQSAVVGDALRVGITVVTALVAAAAAAAAARVARPR